MFPLIFLTFLVFLFSMVAFFSSLRKGFGPAPMFIFLFLLASSLAVFLSKSLLSFYIFFELTVFPTVLMILIWGSQPERLQAGLHFMLYMIVASLPLLLCFVLVFLESGHLLPSSLPPLFSGMGLIFILSPILVKAPAYLVHLWLPKAHVEAPVFGSMLLAAILLKLSGFGLIFLAPLLGTGQSALFIFSLVALLGGPLSALFCFFQKDLKSLVAYSSVAHMVFMLLNGLFPSSLSIMNNVLIMVSHGFTSSGLFFVLGDMYHFLKSRNGLLLKGVLYFLPFVSLGWFFLLALNMSAPPSLSLFCELLSLSVLLSWFPSTIVLFIFMVFFTCFFSLTVYLVLSHGGGQELRSSPEQVVPKTNLLLWLHVFPPLTGVFFLKGF